MHVLADLAPRWAFVDVETTGSSPARERITEVGAVVVDLDVDAMRAARATGRPDEAAAALRVTEWSSLVNPGVPIPPEIQWLTGITNDMVRAAPPFADVAGQLAGLLEGGVLVAHNARFDYGFLRAEFRRAGVDWRSATLCTVRLSRHLHPDRAPHTLDAIVARFGLDGEQRHRALGDARVLWRLLQVLHARHPEGELAEAVRTLLSRPATPPHLPPNVLDELPEAPGVYVFHGPGEAQGAPPLYIGKAVDLRARVAAHFDNDLRSGADLRLSQEVRRIEWQQTAGETGALLREAELVKTRLPAHNILLRRRANTVFVTIDDDGRPRFVKAEALTALPSAESPPQPLDTHHGPFSSRAGARRALVEAARAHALCLQVMKLEGRGRRAAGSGCFNLQLARCGGACVGAEPLPEHGRRVRESLATLRVPAWPHPGAIALVERDAGGGGEDWHVADRWCWLGTVRTLDAALALARSAPRAFEADAYRILRRALAKCAADALVPLWPAST